MIAEATTPDRIELTPESPLEYDIIASGDWVVTIEDPEPLEINVKRLVLIRKEEDDEQ